MNITSKKTTISKVFFIWFVLAWAVTSPQVMAQIGEGYQLPPKEIQTLVDAPVTPVVNFSRSGQLMLLMERPGYVSIEDLSQPELRIGGMRINPATNGRSRSSSYSNITIKKGLTGEALQLKGLPPHPNLGNVLLSADERFLAFTQTASEGISLWVADLESLEAKEVLKDAVNDLYGRSISWLPDNRLLVKI